MDFETELVNSQRFDEYPAHLNMSKKMLKEIPQDIYTFYPLLQFLYLEDNEITEIPEDFFPSMKYLKWLDLRNNLLTAIPSTIANHEYLETLLLKDNKIENLPLELGQVSGLRGLQLQGNPLRSPPPDVVSEGLAAVLRWLRDESQARAARGAVVALPPPAPAAPASDALPMRPRARTAAGVAPVDKESSAGTEGVRSRPAPSAPPRDRYVALLPAPSQQQQSESGVGSRTEGTESKSAGSVDEATLAAAASGNQTVGVLGSRKKMQIIKRMLKEMWLAKISEKLLEQDMELERRKSEEALKNWRKNWKKTGLELVSNYCLKAPYDLHFSDDTENLLKRTPKNRILVEDLAAMEKILTENMEPLETADPAERRDALAWRVEMLTDMQKCLQTIRFKALDDKTYYSTARGPTKFHGKSNTQE